MYFRVRLRSRARAGAAAGAGARPIHTSRYSLLFFSIARGSVMECGALFDLFNALGNLSPDEYRAGKLLLTPIGVMLSN